MNTFYDVTLRLIISHEFSDQHHFADNARGFFLFSLLNFRAFLNVKVHWEVSMKIGEFKDRKRRFSGFNDGDKFVDGFKDFLDKTLGVCHVS